MARFSFPSPGPRGNDDSWFRVGTVEITTTLLIIGMAVTSMFVWALAPNALTSLALVPSEVRKGELWRIVTWPLYNRPDLWAVIALAFFYFFGRELERIMGRVRFLWYCLLLTVVPGLFATALGINAWGMRYIQLACFLGYVVLYPQARSFFNIPLWVLGAVFLGIEVLQLVGFRDYRGLLFLTVVCGTALLSLSAFGLTGHISWLPSRSPSRSPRPPRSPRAPRARRAKLKAVPNPAADVSRPATRPPGDALRQAEIDVLLDKIAAHGIESLTAEEKRRLDEASRRLRDDNR
jgi:membrane associated rhomboid family serine protease